MTWETGQDLCDSLLPVRDHHKGVDEAGQPEQEKSEDKADHETFPKPGFEGNSERGKKEGDDVFKNGVFVHGSIRSKRYADGKHCGKTDNRSSFHNSEEWLGMRNATRGISLR